MRHCLAPDTLKKVYDMVLIAFALACSHPEAALGEPIGDTQNPFAGFDEPSIETESISHPENFFFDNFSGYAKLFAVANTTSYSSGREYRDWQGLSGLRIEAMLEADFRFKGWKIFSSIKGFHDFAYGLNGRGGYTEEVLDSYETELELREAHLQRSLASFVDLKIGRQIVVWGRSDNFRVTDVLNPLDKRELGIVDIENLRLPLTMIKIDFYLENWNLDLISIHEHRYDENPAFGHFFYPASTPLPPERKPSNTLENSEIAAELTGTFSGWDLSFYGAHIFNDQATYIPTNPTELEHQKTLMLGSSISVAKGNMLYNVELAHLGGLRFKNDYEREYNRSDLLVGIEYSGLSDTIISLDYVRRHLHNYDSVLDTSPENPQKNENAFACRITSDFMQDNLQLTSLVIFNGERGQYGAMQRFTAEYDIIDNWSVLGGLLLYQARNGPLATVGDTARLFGELRYDF